MHFVSEHWKFMVIKDQRILVEIIYALPNEQKIFIIEVQKPCTLEFAIQQSGILTHYKEIDLTKLSVGIFGRIKKLSTIVQDGDRIEIYRPLLVDPKEKRRKNAREWRKK